MNNMVLPVGVMVLSVVLFITFCAAWPGVPLLGLLSVHLTLQLAFIWTVASIVKADAPARHDKRAEKIYGDVELDARIHVGGERHSAHGHW